MSQYKTIGFFGDSFCAEVEHSNRKPYDTYIKKLMNHYECNVINLGNPGSSIWDAWINQLVPKIETNNVPDICVFVWTDFGRLYHPTIKGINYSSAIKRLSDIKWKDFMNPNRPENEVVWAAAKMYYEHLYNHDKLILEYKSALFYIDSVILPEIAKKSKIIHLWAFGSPKGWTVNDFKPENISYEHRWNTGVEIRPPMITMGSVGCIRGSKSFDKIFALNDMKELPANHIPGDESNQRVFEYIKYAIENYESGKLLDLVLHENFKFGIE
jgi:hypothetical protein